MNHLRALQVVNYVYGTLLGLGALAMLLVLLVGPGRWAGMPPDGALAPHTGWIALTAGVAVAAGIIGYAGWLVARARGRILQTALAGLNLFEFPVGTLYGLYALWVCWFHDPTREAFRTHTPRPPEPVG